MIKNNQKGSIIYFAILILGILLSAGLASTTIFIRQMGVIREMNFSVGALYAADSGIEEVLYRWEDNIENEDIIDWSGHTMEDGDYIQKYELNKSVNGDLLITSVGSYAATAEYSPIKRAIQISRPTY